MNLMLEMRDLQRRTPNSYLWGFQFANEVNQYIFELEPNIYFKIEIQFISLDHLTDMSWIQYYELQMGLKDPDHYKSDQ